MPARDKVSDEEHVRRATEAWALVERDLRAERAARRSAELRLERLKVAAPPARRFVATLVGGGAWQAIARLGQRLRAAPWRSRSYGEPPELEELPPGPARTELEVLGAAKRRAQADWERERDARARADWRVRALEGGGVVAARAAIGALTALVPQRGVRRPRVLGPFGPAGADDSVIVVAHPAAALVAMLRLTRGDRRTLVVPLLRGCSFAAAAEAGLRAAEGDLAVVWAARLLQRPPPCELLLQRLGSDDRLAAIAPADAACPIAFDWRHAQAVPTTAAASPVGLATPVLALRPSVGGAAAHADADGWEQWSLERTLAISLSGAGLDVVGPPTRPPARAVDQDALQIRFGAALRRRVLADLVAGGGRWCSRRLRVHVARPSTDALVEACRTHGWERAEQRDGADVAVAHAGGDEPLEIDWLPLADHQPALVSESPSQLRAALETSLSTAAIALRAPGRPGGGDHRLARSLERALARRGHQCLVELTSEPQGAAAGLDAALLLRGRHTVEPRPGQANLLWLISHPEELDPAELERFDAVLVASRSYARRLGQTVGVPVTPVLQFADVDTFAPDRDADEAHALAFVGNWRGVLREGAWAALRGGHPPALYGAGWQLVAPEHAVAEHVSPQRLRRVYSSCDVLLNDHWADMRRHGFIANRVFDALACEAFVLSDALPGLEQELPGTVETYRDADELLRKLDEWLPAERDAERRARGRAGRAAVLAGHTADHRATEVAEAVGAAISRRAAAR